MKSSDKTVEEILDTKYGNGPFSLREAIQKITSAQAWDSMLQYLEMYQWRFITPNEITVLGCLVRIYQTKKLRRTINEIL